MKCFCAITAIFALLLGLLSGCAKTIPNVKIAEIGRRQVEFALSRHDTPPVVFETGLGGTLAWWREVYPPIAASATALAYNRAGGGASEAVASVRDGRHVVQELRGLLADQGLAPPYILVGHSLGGLYMQWYARHYPQEVAALILVDSTHPAQLKGRGGHRKLAVLAALAVRFVVAGNCRTGTGRAGSDRRRSAGGSRLSQRTGNRAECGATLGRPLGTG
ncbi:alpha/beta fold hydrolase [Methylomonas koyamae]|uniref:alpha/beta fold hydrolase n=1 Tax=Methylomonas koyamae TaxID=702114 RepID=UPI000A527180|nr:alpha/beta hydrolase [Methylomonas koyamae]